MIQSNFLAHFTLKPKNIGITFTKRKSSEDFKIKYLEKQRDFKSNFHSKFQI